jgi:hypothetical protein
MLTCHRQRLPILLSIMEQKTLIPLERSFCDLGRIRDVSAFAPNEEHLHMNATHSQGAIGEALYGKMLEIFLQERG